MRNTRHPMHGQNSPTSRLRSRKSFLKTSEGLSEKPWQSRISEWKHNYRIQRVKGGRDHQKTTSWPRLTIDGPMRRVYTYIPKDRVLGQADQKKIYENTVIKIRLTNVNESRQRRTNYATMRSRTKPMHARWSDDKRSERAVDAA